MNPTHLVAAALLVIATAAAVVYVDQGQEGPETQLASTDQPGEEAPMKLLPTRWHLAAGTYKGGVFTPPEGPVAPYAYVMGACTGTTGCTFDLDGSALRLEATFVADPRGASEVAFGLRPASTGEVQWADEDGRLVLEGDRPGDLKGEWGVIARPLGPVTSFAFGFHAVEHSLAVPEDVIDVPSWFTGREVVDTPQANPAGWCANDCTFEVPEGTQSFSFVSGQSSLHGSSLLLRLTHESGTTIEGTMTEEGMGRTEVDGDNLAGTWTVSLWGDPAAADTLWYGYVVLETGEDA